VCGPSPGENAISPLETDANAKHINTDNIEKIFLTTQFSFLNRGGLQIYCIHPHLNQKSTFQQAEKNWAEREVRFGSNRKATAASTKGLWHHTINNMARQLNSVPI
jgi:hypothetical protein